MVYETLTQKVGNIASSTAGKASTYVIAGLAAAALLSGCATNTGGRITFLEIEGNHRASATDDPDVLSDTVNSRMAPYDSEHSRNGAIRSGFENYRAE